MQALVYNGPWDLTVEAVADPEVGHGEVLSKVLVYPHGVPASADAG